METLENKNSSEGNNIESLYNKTQAMLKKGENEEAAEALAGLAENYEISEKKELEILFDAVKVLSKLGKGETALDLLAEAHKLSEKKDN